VADTPFTVVNSQEASHQFRMSLERAHAHGELEVALQGARWIMHELAHAPQTFGESREEVSPYQLAMRIGFASPMYAIFGIHEPSRTVFVRKIGYSARKA
jgi:hypothetical protein